MRDLTRAADSFPQLLHTIDRCLEAFLQWHYTHAAILLGTALVASCHYLSAPSHVASVVRCVTASPARRAIASSLLTLFPWRHTDPATRFALFRGLYGLDEVPFPVLLYIIPSTHPRFPSLLTLVRQRYRHWNRFSKLLRLSEPLSEATSAATSSECSIRWVRSPFSSLSAGGDLTPAKSAKSTSDARRKSVA